MPSISLIVPHWPLRPEHDALLQRCVRSIPAEEKIIVVNEGTGMGKAINQGFALASGDYFIVSNNDCELVSGDIRDLCDPEAITLPDQMDGQWHLPRAFYCLPRWVYEQVGGYDERFQVGYFEDDDLIRRWQQAAIPFRMTKVRVKHTPATTLGHLPDTDAIFQANKARFIEKWGER